MVWPEGPQYVGVLRAPKSETLAPLGPRLAPAKLQNQIALEDPDDLQVRQNLLPTQNPTKQPTAAQYLTNKQTNIYIYTHTHMHIRMYTHPYTYTYTCGYTAYIYIYIYRMHIHIYIYRYVCVAPPTYICMHIRRTPSALIFLNMTGGPSLIPLELFTQNGGSWKLVRLALAREALSRPWRPSTLFSSPSAAVRAGRHVKAADSDKLEHGCRMIHALGPSVVGLGLEDGHVPTFWLLLQPESALMI